jgi:hypothetical protein
MQKRFTLLLVIVGIVLAMPAPTLNAGKIPSECFEFLYDFTCGEICSPWGEYCINTGEPVDETAACLDWIGWCHDYSYHYCCDPDQWP